MTPSSVTKGMQVALPAYPGLVIAVGLLFLLQSPERTTNESYVYAKQVMSIPHWGLLFLTLGVFKVSAFIANNGTWLRWCLICGAGLSGFWSGLLFWSAYNIPTVSYTGGVWVMFAAILHIASARSLTKDTVWHG